VNIRALLIEEEKRIIQALCVIFRPEKYDIDRCDDDTDGLGDVVQRWE
jgi:hypothetical protein